MDDFVAPHFHFREFADKKDKWKIPNNPFLTWSEQRRDRFLYELAILASDEAVPCGGFYGANHHRKLGLGGNPFEKSIALFFEDCIGSIDSAWPGYDGKILFISDKCERPDWIVPLHKVHKEFSEKDGRIGGLTFEDDKDPMHISLQAADLLAYVFRQYGENVYKAGMWPNLRTLDFFLTRNREPNLRNLSKKDWGKIVKMIISDQKRQKAEWKKAGKDKPYIPADHFPFESHRIKKLWKQK